MLKYVHFFVLFLFSLHSQGQPSAWNDLKLKYPEESSVFLYRDKVITLQIKNDSLVANAEIKESILFLKDRPDNASDMRIFGSHFQEVSDVLAKTEILEKSKYRDVPLSGLTRKREDDASVFYDDSYFYHMSFPMSHAGNKATWSFKEYYSDVKFLPSFYFQGYLPQVTGGVTLRVPEGVEVKWQIRNDQNGLIKFKEYKKDRHTHYQWSVADIAAAKWEDSGPKSPYFIPHIIFQVVSWKNKDRTIPVLSDLDDLHHWYSGHLSQLDEKPSEELMGVLKELVKPGDREIDVVQKVFYWVQDNIRYIAFEDGMRGFIPHKPNYVLEKRYGDCKDMASLIVGMLKAAGVKSYYTWIGTRDLPYRYSETPTPVVDNHMIATYIDARKNYFYLDGTSNYTSVLLPSSMIQGKEAFIALDSNQYEIREVPKIGPEVSLNVDTVRLKIENNSLIGNGTTYLTGFQKIDASYAFNKTQAVRQKENVLSWIQKGSNKFFLDSYTLKQIESKDKPLIITYDFRVSDYVNYVGEEIFVNLNLEKIYYNQVISSERRTPVMNDYEFTMNNRFVLEIPSGYEVGYLPPNVSTTNSVLSFSISYQQSDTAVILEASVIDRSLILNPDQFEIWNNSVKQLSKAYKESVIFKKKSK